MHLNFDPTQATLGDMEWFETYTNTSMGEFDEETMSARQMVAMAAISLYNSDRAAYPTYESAVAAARGVKLSEITVTSE